MRSSHSPPSPAPPSRPAPCWPSRRSAGFLRAGGWPRIRRRVGWASAATTAAGGALCWTVIALPAKASDQLNVPLNYFVGIVVTGALFAVTLGLWAGAARGTARNLCLSHRARAAETVVVAVSAAAVFMMVSASMLFTAAIQSSAAQLLVGIAGERRWGFIATRNLQRALRSGSACGPAPGRA